MEDFMRKVANMLSDSKFGTAKKFCDPLNFNFLDPFSIEDSIANGLILNSVYVPQEIIETILMHLNPREILRYSVVCKLWCNIIKSDAFWYEWYKKYCPTPSPKQLPWYVYYCYCATDNFTNLLKNVNGEEKFAHWTIVADGGDKICVEDTPQGADPLPQGVEDFCGSSKCFATSFGISKKLQDIDLRPKRLLRYILLKYKPKIYGSEYMAGRFDCSCKYELAVEGFSTTTESRKALLFSLGKPVFVEQWHGGTWNKVEIEIDDYDPQKLAILRFVHEGTDRQFWKGHYGSKFAGGVLRFDFNSMEQSNNL